jgi:hypothetical protein
VFLLHSDRGKAVGSGKKKLLVCENEERRLTCGIDASNIELGAIVRDKNTLNLI